MYIRVLEPIGKVLTPAAASTLTVSYFTRTLFGEHGVLSRQRIPLVLDARPRSRESGPADAAEFARDRQSFFLFFFFTFFSSSLSATGFHF